MNRKILAGLAVADQGTRLLLRLVPGNLPPQLVDLLPVVKPSGAKLIKVSFESPTPEGKDKPADRVSRPHRMSLRLENALEGWKIRCYY